MEHLRSVPGEVYPTGVVTRLRACAAQVAQAMAIFRGRRWLFVVLAQCAIHRRAVAADGGLAARRQQPHPGYPQPVQSFHPRPITTTNVHLVADVGSTTEAR